jgi:ribosome assembly protein 4
LLTYPPPPSQHRLARPQAAQKRYDEATGGRPERLVSGSDDFTMFLWQPSAGKAHLARLTGHVQLINQVGA